MSVAVVIATMLLLVVVGYVEQSPSCVQCGGRLAHRRGCPLDR